MMMCFSTRVTKYIIILIGTSQSAIARYYDIDGRKVERDNGTAMPTGQKPHAD